MAKIIQPARAHNRRSLLTAAHHSLACLRVELSGNPRRAMPMQLTASLPPIRGRSEGGKVRWGRARAGGKRREGKDVPGGFWMQRVSAAQHFALVDHICHVDGSTGLGTEPLRDLGNEGGGGRRRTEEGKKPRGRRKRRRKHRISNVPGPQGRARARRLGWHRGTPGLPPAEALTDPGDCTAQGGRTKVLSRSSSRLGTKSDCPGQGTRPTSIPA
ncbi:unnamed protein product [Prorocentrum cordatum]|uniref:Uncharacterized protein n=1 Tax=Prorocentrum cordatum TaxID=2364126 RepID=A0ABN9PRC6_9DINO|nr:unnamed protein product [Polarella glacialis]